MELADERKRKIRDQWDRSAIGWDKRFEWYTRNLGPLIEWCCDAAALRPGARVLDVGTGAGQPAVAAAARVGPTGAVVSIDISPEMLRVTAERARTLRLENLEVRAMDGEHLQFGDASFDAVTCACTLMFFPDAVRALREMRRVLAPGARFALAVWDDAAKSAYFSLFNDALAQVIPTRPPRSDAPHPFRFALPGALEAVLQDAGFSEFVVESRPMVVDCESADQYWALIMDFAGALKPTVDALPAADHERLRALVREGAERFMSDGRLRLTLTPLCATGRV